MTNINYKNQSGQVVLVVMLISALILTLGLSASKQATVETRIDSDEELLKQAFNTAESGVDYYLSTGIKQYGNTDSAAGSANLTVTQIGNNGNVLSLENVTADGGTELFWLASHDVNGGIMDDYYKGTFHICSQDASLIGNFKIDYFYNTGASTFGVTRYYETNKNCVDLDLNNNSVLLAVTPIGFSPRLKVTGPIGNFPVQGEEISSVGTVGKVNSTVRVLNKYDVPVFMLDAVTSSGNISNN